MSALSIKECLRFGWETFKARPWIFVGAGVVVFLIQLLMNALGATVNGSLAALPFSLVALAVSLFVQMGTLHFVLRAHDDTTHVELRDLWYPRPFWPFVGAKILVGLAVLLGLILLIVPGIIIALALMLAPYLVVDKNYGPIVAMKASWSLTKGKRWKLFGLALSVIGLNILGTLALLIGLAVTIPVSMLAIAHAYRTLAEEPSIASAPVTA